MTEDSGAGGDAAADSGTTDGGPGDAGSDAGPGDDAGPSDDAGSDAGPPGSCPTTPLPALTTVSITSRRSPFTRPVDVAQAPGRPDTLFVVEQAGRIRVVRGGSVVGTFLDIRSRVRDRENERGLLGLAFHPDYETNGRFFVFYTAQEPATPHPIVVAEYARSASDPDVANPTEVARLVDDPDPESNHNGGNLAFGPDGFLYAGIGDGGGAGDRHPGNGNGQNLTTLSGSILRLDVDNTAGAYAAAGNPFTMPTGLPQIWAYGLRNPWRFSFDRTTGDLYIGDVGQNAVEEIDFQPASSTGGENYGWRAFEGTRVFDAPLTATVGPIHTPPILDIPQSGDAVFPGPRAIVGGYVYRGAAIPSLDGWYIFGDAASAEVGAFRYCEDSVRDYQRVPGLMGRGAALSSLGEDLAGELYLVYLFGNEVHQIVAM